MRCHRVGSLGVGLLYFREVEPRPEGGGDPVVTVGLALLIGLFSLLIFSPELIRARTYLSLPHRRLGLPVGERGGVVSYLPMLLWTTLREKEGSGGPGTFLPQDPWAAASAPRPA